MDYKEKEREDFGDVFKAFGIGIAMCFLGMLASPITNSIPTPGGGGCVPQPDMAAVDRMYEEAGGGGYTKIVFFRDGQLIQVFHTQEEAMLAGY